tara:strand:+ start:2296 stop:3615 length:1320 start_codon:yes stop_codon:yes gene_type:complete
MMGINNGFFKKVEDGSSVIRPITINTDSITISGSDLKFYAADRRNLTTSQNNIFMTMNLPLTPTQRTVFGSNFPTGTSYNFSGTSGFNQNVIVYTPIPPSKYGELVVGHSIHMKVPVQTGSTIFGIYCGVVPCVSTIDIYASYQYQGGYKNSFDGLTSEGSPNSIEFGQPMYDINGQLINNNPYNSNVVFLFSDFVRRPNNDTSKSWATQSSNALVNTNKVFKNGKDTFNYESLNMTGRDKVDVPVGLCMLDSGFCAITHPYIVDILSLTAGTTTGTGWVTPSSGTYSGPGTVQSGTDSVGSAWASENGASNYGDVGFDGGWKNQGDSGSPFTAIYFTGGTASSGGQTTAVSASTSFRTVSTDYVQSITCVAEAGSWGTSTNPTWIEEYSESGSNNAGVYVTKIGLWDENHNLLGVAVPDVPILKTQTQFLTATLNLTR